MSDNTYRPIPAWVEDQGQKIKGEPKLWNLVGPEWMKSRELDPESLREYYRQRNLLKARVKAEHGDNAVVFFASEQTPTTGATLPVDGGNPAAFPR